MTINSNAYFLYDFNRKVTGKQAGPDVAKKSEIFRYNYAHEFCDHKLHMSYKEGKWVSYADTYAPNVFCLVNEEICRYEFSACFSAAYPYDKSVFMACFVGARVSSAVGGESNPNLQNSGFFVAFNDKPNARIYHCLKDTWPEGVCTIPLPASFVNMRTLYVTDDGQFITYSMMTDAGRMELLRADLTGDRIIVYDSNGYIAYMGENNLKSHKGGYFKIFNHMAQTIISDVAIHATERHGNKMTEIFHDSFARYDTSSNYKILSFSTGPHNYVINENFYKVEKDDILLIAPYDIHSTFDNYPQRMLLQFNIDYLRQFFNEFLVNEALHCFHYKVLRLSEHKQLKLKNILRELGGMGLERDEGISFIRLYEILYLLHSENAEVIYEEYPNKRISDILRFINDNYATINGIEVIAEHFYITKCYLCKTFKQSTGNTVIDYLNHVKIKNACRMMTDGKAHSITDIATQSGFNSSAYFGALFKNIVGTTPKQFMLRLRQ